MKLVIAEKPSVAESIAKVIGAHAKRGGYIEGGDYVVTWCIGHIVSLSLPDSYGEQYREYRSFDILPIIPSEWKFQIASGKSKQFNVIKELMNRADVDQIICATDAGREGECIFRYVYNYAKCKKPVMRLWISSMEDKAIREGMANLKPDSEYDNLYMAGLSRAKADWLVGMNGSRLFSARFQATLNVGRVQTPVLAMVVQRGYDIEHFVKQQYYTVVLDCGSFSVSSERFDDETEARELSSICDGKSAFAREVKKENKTVNPPKLYDLTTLQREANRKFGYTAKQTLEYTQSLYEAKLVTYPRTDSQYVTSDDEETLYDIVGKVLEYIPEYQNADVSMPNVDRCINNKKVSDHTAIIPTAEIANVDLNTIPASERNILLLIAGKLLVATSEPHIYETVKVTVNCENHDFTASGKTVISEGFKALEKYIGAAISGNKNTEGEENDNNLPEIAEGEVFENVKSSVASHFTTPPKPYTEDTLLKAMETAGNNDYDENSDVEKKGLGTPATRADIIENLVKRDYLLRKNKSIIATEKGINLIEVVPEEVKSPKLTADWETCLQNIEKGSASSEAFMSDIERFVTALVGNYSQIVEGVFKGGHEPLGVCPRCKKNVIENKLSFQCESGKDGCGFTIWKDNKVPKAKITAEAVRKFLSEGKAELKTVNKDGEAYKGTFEMVDTGKYVNFVYCKKEKVVIGSCPKCSGHVLEKEKSFCCENMECKFVIWKSINGKSISSVQAKKLITKGKTDLISGFNRKQGGTFNAYLVLKDDKSVGFEMPKRK